MSAQWFVKSVALLTFVGAATLPLSAQVVRGALPGTVNYVEGQVSINGNPLNSKQDGSIQVQPNQNLMTANGHAEMLLSPGIFVRSGNNSDIRLVSNGLANPAIEVVRGEAMVEVDQKAVDAQIDILEHGATASILKDGLYRFDSNQNSIEVIDGKLRVTEDGKTKELGKGREVVANGAPLKTVGFDRKAEDDLFRWSSVRSAYLAEANMSTARTIYMGYDPYGVRGGIGIHTSRRGHGCRVTDSSTARSDIRSFRRATWCTPGMEDLDTGAVSAPVPA